MLNSFHLNFLQNKMWPTDLYGHTFRDARMLTSQSSFRSSNNLFRPALSATWASLWLFSKLKFPLFSSKSNNSIGNDEERDIFKLLKAATIVYNLHMQCAFSAWVNCLRVSCHSFSTRPKALLSLLKCVPKASCNLFIAISTLVDQIWNDKSTLSVN